MRVYKQRKITKEKLLVSENTKLDLMMVVIYLYLERKNCEGLKFLVNNVSYFEISTSLF